MSFRLPAADIWAVAAGGVIGSGLRYGIDLIFPFADPVFPWQTLAINVTGAFALALVTGSLWMRPSTPSWVKAGVGTGAIGSYTTFSAFAVSLFSELIAGHWITLVLYLLCTMVLGFAATVLGLRLANRATSDDGRVTR
ncbi:fluoride efflux transporter FluC [Lacisediminihabitans changchengi]|uniref:Fluoride-specific ion channel FluC n=1 Tax=Lacisediminihabitans changchengi TaxID=2787634 RepID=A0A934SV10_9MICO|nr:CrcB family protein [Lacisediminihabitans changchengi]MBK4348539.1 CrcB family protein [Lacisediminihabitans changchengi]